MNTDETGARLAALEVLHAASVEVATKAGWDVGPFEAAYAIVRENPRYVVPGPWKANRKRTHEARVVFEELWDGTRFHLEVRGAEGVTAYEPQWARLRYLGSRSVGAASEVKDPIWRAGGAVALRDRRGADILTVTVPAVRPPS